MKKSIPGPLWVAIVSCGLMILGKIASIGKIGPIILVDAALTALLLFGLIRGHKWAYVLTIVFVVLGTLLGFRKGAQTGMVILVFDCLVLIPVLICTKYFFPEPEAEAPNTDELPV